MLPHLYTLITNFIIGIDTNLERKLLWKGSSYTDIPTGSYVVRWRIPHQPDLEDNGFY